MRLLPRVVQTLITSTPDATRVRDGITAAVQPTLDFLNGYFKSAADGSLQIMRDVSIQGALSVAKAAAFNGAFKVLGDFALTGNFYAKVRTGNGFVIQSGAVGPTFYVTNVAGNQAVFLVYSDGGVVSLGSMNAANFNSGAGFKSVVKFGGYWNTAPGANTTFSFGDTVQNVQNASMGFTPFYEKMTHAGSVVGLSLNEAGPNTATKTLYVYKNNAELFRWTTGAGGNNATFWQTWAKGQYTFAQGDTINIYGSVGSTANTQLTGYITYELSA